jgi:small-conductance mechanosensitive channel
MAEAMDPAFNVTAVTNTITLIEAQSNIIRYILGAVVVVLSYFISRFAGKTLHKIGSKLADHTSTRVDDELLRVSIKPVKVTIVIIGVLGALFISGWDADSLRLMANPLVAIALLVLARIVVHTSCVFIEEYGVHLAEMADTSLDKRFIPTIQAILSIVIYSVAGLMALSSLGVDVTPLVTLGGVAGIAVAVASQDTLGNVVAGIIVMYDKPFASGDLVLIGGPEGEGGTVLAVGLFSTKVRTWDNNVITFPNSDLYKKGAVNYSYGDERVRVRIPVGVAYGTDIEKVRGILLDIAKEDESVLDEPEPRALFLSFGDFAYDFELRVYIKDLMDIFNVKDRINTNIKTRFDEKHIEIPFPVRTLLMPKNALK